MIEQHFELIQAEYERANRKFPPFHSPHEALAIIEEEFEELRQEVFKHSHQPSLMAKEVVQVAAMCCKFLDMLEGEA